MINNQKLFDMAAHSLRVYGNPFGDVKTRGWGYVNENKPGERCALARLVEGNTAAEVEKNLCILLGYKSNIELYSNQLVLSIIKMFETQYEILCTSAEGTENLLMSIATDNNLKYVAIMSQYFLNEEVTA